jgi:hypothetical protein
MYCPACGTVNAEGAAQCVRCASALPPSTTFVPRKNVPNYLVQAILVTIFCCLPFGIVSIVYASQVNGKAQAGDLAGAMEASGKARTWAWVSFAIGLAGSILYFVLTAAGIMQGIGGL